MSTTSSTASASGTQMDYLNLLITELTNQNPLDPMENNEMAAQMAQFSQLQMLEDMSANFGSVLETAQMDYAASLIGKSATYLDYDNEGNVIEMEGVIEKAGMSTNGRALVEVSGVAVYLEDLLTVQQ